MDNPTGTTLACAQCGEAFTPSRNVPGKCAPKYCSRLCHSRAARANERGCCSEAGCNRPVRAKGVCARHYQARRQAAGLRTPQVVVQCAYCARDCMKDATRYRKYKHLFCSLRCGGQYRAGHPRGVDPDSYCPVPADHPVAILIRNATEERKATLAEQRRLAAARRARKLEGAQPRECDDCGTVYTPTTGERQKYCSYRCKKRVVHRLRRAREFEAVGTWKWTAFMGLFVAFGRCCAYCHSPIDGQPDPDHVLALSRGGSNTLTNILPACRACNSDKRDLTLDEWAADRRRRGLTPRLAAIPQGDHRYVHVVLLPPRQVSGSTRRDGASHAA